MEGDEYFCRACHMDWVDKRACAPFCPHCYSKDLINLTEQKRIESRKNAEEDAARKRKEEKIQAEKMYRRKILKNRDRSKKYYRGKNK